MLNQRNHVFVVEVGDSPALAFAASHIEGAREIICASWLRRVLATHWPADFASEVDPRGLRAANIAETALYNERADEFAEEAVSGILLVRVNSPDPDQR